MMKFNEFILICASSLTGYEEVGYSVEREYKEFPSQYICNYVKIKNEIITVGIYELSDSQNIVTNKEFYLTNHIGLLNKLNGGC